MTLFLTCHTKHNLVARITHGVPSLPKAPNDSAFRQVEWKPWRGELHQTARVPLARRGCVLASWRAYPLHQGLQIGTVQVVFALVDVDAITLMQCRNMIGRLPRADATRRMDWSGPWACERPLHRHAVVHAEGWW